MRLNFERLAPQLDAGFDARLEARVGESARAAHAHAPRAPRAFGERADERADVGPPGCPSRRGGRRRLRAPPSLGGGRLLVGVARAVEAVREAAAERVLVDLVERARKVGDAEERGVSARPHQTDGLRVSRRQPLAAVGETSNRYFPPASRSNKSQKLVQKIGILDARDNSSGGTEIDTNRETRFETMGQT